jgi:exodeoxyribonuclease V alpha subunit
MTKERDNDSSLAFRMMGRALLRLVETPPTPLLQEAVDVAMQSLAVSEEQGSICAVVGDETLSAAGAAALVEARLAVWLDDSVDNRNANAKSEEDAVNAPLVLERLSGDKAGLRLYLQRRFDEEMRLAWMLKRYAERPAQNVDAKQWERLAALKENDWRLYGENRMDRNTFERNRLNQDEAVARALERRFSIVCGGPGTGKTTTVVRMLECLLVSRPSLRIALAAPTGKAAGRMMQSIRNSIESMPRTVSDGVARAIEEGRLIERTIHKWLVTPQESGNKPSAAEPLNVDVIVIDEASMIDIRLAVQLFGVLDPDRTRVIVLGDKHQLSAVGPGAVFADMCRPDGVLNDCVSRLTVSHRFSADSMIGRLAAAVNNERGLSEAEQQEAVEELFRCDEQAKDRVAWHGLRRGGGLAKSLKTWLDKAFRPYFDELEKWTDDKELTYDVWVNSLWNCLNKTRVLAAQRKGTTSVEAVNAYLCETLRERLETKGIETYRNVDLMPGLVIIIRQNNDVLGVYNGDVGILLPNPDDRSNRAGLTAYFGDSGKRLPAALLPEYEPAFAMTIHQSQGSEYDQVAVLLPGDDESELATRELLYTGITRAKRSVHVFGAKATLNRAMVTTTRRQGALTERLRTVRVDR